MSIPIIFMLCSLPLLLLLSAFFSGSETALFSLSQHQRQQLARSDGIAGSTITTLLAETRSLLITLLLGNMTVNVLYFAISAMLSIELSHVQATGPILAPAASVGALLGIILLGEVLPKLTAARLTLPWARLISLPLLVFHRTIAPIRIASSWLVITPLARLIAPPTKPAPLSIQELESLLTLSQSQGVIDSDEQQLLEQIMALGQIKVRDLMVPRVDIKAHSLDQEPGKLLELIRSTHLRYIPLYRGDLDNIVGLLCSRDVLLKSPGSKADVAQLARPVKYVPQQQRADQLLVELRMAAATMALVVDEYGGTAGLVTIEDVVEQMVGDIPGAYQGRDQTKVELIEPGRWRVSADLSIHDWPTLIGPNPTLSAKQLPPTVATLGGLMMARLDKVPDIGERIRIGNLLITVDAMAGKRIATLCVQLDQEAAQNTTSGIAS